MKITFDQRKRDATFTERGLAFEDAAVVFEGETLTVEDRRSAYGEARYQTVGFSPAAWSWWCGPHVAPPATSSR